VDFLVRRDDLRTTRIDDAAPPASDELAHGEVLLRVDEWALTANNVTYAAFGDAMGYWRFFPAPDGWGRIPVWGFADVEVSAHPELEVGERLYGYLPMSTHLVVRPGRVRPGGFADASEHRAELPAVYNQYERASAMPAHDPTREREQSVLRPLFTTSFLIDDWLADNDLFGAGAVVLSSASSKTSLGLAHQLSRHRRAAVVGLTSPANHALVERTGWYDRILTYDALDELRHLGPAVFVDMAGDAAVLERVHHALAPDLRASCRVGATHWEEAGPLAPDLPGPAPQLFFAPSQVDKRRADWGPGGFEERFAGEWSAFLSSVDGWLELTVAAGPDEVDAVYHAVLEGRSRPEQGHVLSMWSRTD